MQFTLYLYGKLVPNSENKKRWLCNECGRVVFKYSHKEVLLTNSMGGVDSIPPSSSYISMQCHSCKAKYRVLFQ